MALLAYSLALSSALALLCLLVEGWFEPGFLHGLAVAVAIAALVAAFGASTLLALRFARPFAIAARAADGIAAGKLDTALPTRLPGEPGRFVAAMRALQRRVRDLSEKEAARGRSAQNRVIEALESSTEAMILLDPERRIVIANSRVKDVLGPLGAAKIKDGLSFAEAFTAEHAEWATKLSAPGEIKLPTGTWLSITREEAIDGGVFLIWTDITLRKSYELKLEIAAYEDPLTGVRNRAFLVEHLDRHGLANTGKTSRAAMLVANIDRFRQINNAHGSRIGDGVLVTVAERLKSLMEPSELCARIGGDEFVIWIPDSSDDRCEQLAQAVTEAFAVPVATSDRVLPVHLSGGIARAGSAGETGHDLLRDARAALERARAQGGDRVELFNEALREETRIRLRIEADLPDAIRNRQLYLDYQPLIDLSTGLIGGLEALVRWRHPELGQIPPGRFVPIAEESGAIVELGWFVLESAAAQAAQWFADGLLDEGATIAVNLSPRQIADPRNAQELLDYLDRNAGAVHWLKFEVTEGVLLQDPAAMVQLLRAFKKRGVGLSLDDFGTGFSSLSYLHKFPFDVLKIDRSFVMDIPDSSEAMRLVRTIIELGEDLGLTLVAEGVETEAQAECLKSFGCDFAQGYFFSRPIPPGEITTLLRDQRPAATKRVVGTR